VEKDTVENGYYESDYMLTFKDRDLMIDAADPMSCFGRFANDSLSKETNNCDFAHYDGMHAGYLIATQDIAKNDEILISYGPKFWTGNHYDILSAEDKLFVDNR
jgi:hypothetical protein